MDESIELLGGGKPSNSSYYISDFEYDIPFSFNMSGQLATKIKINSSSDTKIVELLNATGDKLAYAIMELNAFDFQSNTKFIILKKSSNSLLLQWNLINEQGVEITAEFVLLSDEVNGTDIFGWRTEPNEYVNTIFDSSNHAAGCSVSKNDTYTEYNIIDFDFDDWKSRLAENYDEFAEYDDGSCYVCSTDIQLTSLTHIVSEMPCNVPEGSIEISVAVFEPETTTYEVNWVGPDNFTSTGEEISNLNEGEYTVTVIDSNGCEETATYDVDSIICP